MVSCRASQALLGAGAGGHSDLHTRMTRGSQGAPRRVPAGCVCCHGIVPALLVCGCGAGIMSISWAGNRSGRGSTTSTTPSGSIEGCCNNTTTTNSVRSLRRDVHGLNGRAQVRTVPAHGYPVGRRIINALCWNASWDAPRLPRVIRHRRPRAPVWVRVTLHPLIREG